jgi:hypothetical protein
MGEMKNPYKILVGEIEGKKSHGRTGHRLLTYLLTYLLPGSEYYLKS